MKNTNTALLGILSLITALVTVPVLIGYAAPAAAPPNLNVDANFNTVKAGYGAITPILAADFRGTNIGIQGQATGAGGYGVMGQVSSATGYGVVGTNTNAGGTAGLFQNSTATTSAKLGGPAVGLLASYTPPVNSNGSAAIFGATDPLTGTTYKAYMGNYSTIPSSSWYAGRFEAGAGASLITVGLATAGNAVDADGVIKNGGLSIAKNGWISASTTAVKIADSQGLEVADDLGTVGLRIASNGDMSDDGGSVSVVDPEGLWVSGTTLGVAATAGSAAGFAGSFSNTWDADPDAESWAKFAQYIAAAGGDIAGEFTNFDGTNTVKTRTYLGTESAAVDAFGAIKNAGLTIAANGDLSAGPGLPVNVNDTDGLKSNGRIYATDGTWNASLWPDGGVQAQGSMDVESFIFNANHTGIPGDGSYGQYEVAGGPDDVVINDRLYITPSVPFGYPNAGQSNYIHGGGSGVRINDAAGVTIDATAGAKGLIVNNAAWNGGLTVNAANGGMTINSANGGLTINSASGGLTLQSQSWGGNGLKAMNTWGFNTIYLNAQNGQAEFFGKVTSNTGFGTYSFVGWNSIPVPAASTASLTISCPGSGTAIACSYWANLNVKPYYQYASGSSCYIGFTNPGGLSTVWGAAQCLDPAS